MKYRYSIFILLQLFSQFCFAQNIIKKDAEDYQSVLSYIEGQTDVISLNSIIEVNGKVHSRDTYGYIDYLNTDGLNKRCYFLHLGGVIAISKREYDEIVNLPDSSKVEITICLQSPVVGKWGSYWETAMIKGTFEARLNTTHHWLTPCFHFIVTSIGKELFKIQFDGWGVQTCYYSVDLTPMTSRQRKRLDSKECKIYDRANKLDFKRELW